MGIVHETMNTASFVKLTFDRVVRGKTVSSSRVVPASSVEFEVSGLLEKGAFNFETTVDENVDEEVEREFEAMLASGDFSKLAVIS